jgi:uracil-DNA glycosylase
VTRIAGVSDFVESLLAYTRANVFNPYRDHCIYDSPANTLEAKCARLVAHLNIEDPVMLAVGEAPGYQGCRYSGVAFTSERMLMDGRAPRIAPTSRLTTLPRVLSEPSATILWGALEDNGVADRVVLFNSFPFHPFREHEPLSNRTPTRAELEDGLQFLAGFRSLYPSTPIYPIGQKAAEAFAALGWPVSRVLRHPANGGASKLRRALDEELKALGVAKPTRIEFPL